VVARDKQYAAFLRRFCLEIGCQLDAMAAVTTETIAGGCIVYTFPSSRNARRPNDPEAA
jgi:hypothetical protein